jgi:hypothetical protein
MQMAGAMDAATDAMTVQRIRTATNAQRSGVRELYLGAQHVGDSTNEVAAAGSARQGS